MPKLVKIGLGEVEKGELLRDLDNQAGEMEENPEQYLALQALRRARSGRWAVVYRARALTYSIPRPVNRRAWIEPLIEEIAVLSLHLPVGDQLDPAHQPAPHIGEAFRGIAGLRGELDFPQHVRQGPRGVENCFESDATFGANQRIGVLPGWEARETQAPTCTQERERPIERSSGGALTRRIAVETENGLRSEAPEVLQLKIGQRRPQRCHGGRETRAMQRDHIHIAFGDDHPSRRGRRSAQEACPCRRPAVQHAPFLEEWGFG